MNLVKLFVQSLLCLTLLGCSNVSSPALVPDTTNSDLSVIVDTTLQDTVVVAPDLGPAPDNAISPPQDTTQGVDTSPLLDTPTSTTPNGIRFVRVHTSQSPSWVSWYEIEVWGAPAGQSGFTMNLALNKPVTASISEEASPAKNTVDGDLSSSWNAGDFAPATITIDLEIETTIENVRLLVRQQPAGQTTHTVSFGDADGNFHQVHAFNEDTDHNQWLEFTYEENNTPPDVLDPPPSNNLPRGIAWTRANPMFISALSVSTGHPSQAEVNEYYDQFNANAAHLWNDGITAALDGWQNANHPKSRWLSWVLNDGTSFNDQVIGGLSPNSAGRIGYQVGDEPGLHGNGMEELQELAVGVDAVRAADPDALIVINFSFWAEDFAELLEYYGSQVDGDIYSYDRYSMGYNEHETLSQVRDSALKWNRPYWRYLKSYHDLGKTNELHETDYRWSAFIGLLYGYTGHTWFVYQAQTPHVVESDLFPSQGGFSQTKLSPWYVIAELNKEMANLGRAVTQLTSTDVRYVPGQTLYLPDGLVAWTPGAGSDPYITEITVQESSLLEIHDLAVGYFQDDDGEIYVMIQNQQHKSAQFPIDNMKASTIEVTFNFSSAPANINTAQVAILDHVTGTQQSLPLQPAGNGKMKLIHELAAGDPVFFKYDTGKDFPLGPL